MEWNIALELFFAFAGAAFSGLRWYSDFQKTRKLKRRKRNNPPSHKDQTDRHAG